MSAHFNMPEFDHKAFSKYLNENKLTPFSKLNSLIEGMDEAVPFEKDALDKEKELEEIGMFHDPRMSSSFNDANDAWENGAYHIRYNMLKKRGVDDEKAKKLADTYENKPWEEVKKLLNLNETEELEEMANFFMVTQDQKDKIDPDKYSGTKKLVAQALKSDDIEAGQPFTKATIKNILGKDPLKDFNAVLDAEEIGGMGKTGDIRPSEPKTPGVRGRKPGAKAEKEPSAPTTRDKVVGVKDIDGPRPADVTAAEKELGGSKGIDRTIAIDKAGKAIIDKLKNSKEQLKDPKFKEAKRLAFIAYLTRPKSEGGKIGLRKGGETYTNLLNVWDNTVEDLIS